MAITFILNHLINYIYLIDIIPIMIHKSNWSKDNRKIYENNKEYNLY